MKRLLPVALVLVLAGLGYIGVGRYGLSDTPAPDSTAPEGASDKPVVTRSPVPVKEAAPEVEQAEAEPVRSVPGRAMGALAEALGGTAVSCGLSDVALGGPATLGTRQMFSRVEGDAMHFVAEEPEGSQVVFDTSKPGGAGLLTWKEGEEGVRCEVVPLEPHEVELPVVPGSIVLFDGGGCTTQGVLSMGPEGGGTVSVAQSGDCFATILRNGRSGQVNLVDPVLDEDGLPVVTMEEGTQARGVRHGDDSVTRPLDIALESPDLAPGVRAQLEKWRVFEQGKADMLREVLEEPGGKTVITP